MNAKDYLLANITKLQAVYNPSSLIEKLTKVGKKAGVKVVYTVLVLYYALFDEEIPAKDRMMVMAALGYFILPVDLIPDDCPWALRTIWPHWSMS